MAEEKKKKEKKKELLVPLEQYMKAGIYLGTKIITGDMRKYIYKRRADGIAIFNTSIIDSKLHAVCSLLSKYDAKKIVLCCKREAGWKAAELLSRITGIICFTKKYPAGIITNPSLENFFEPSLLIVADPWLDKNALHDAFIINIPVIALCDANNLTKNIDIVVPCNNKSEKSLGLIFYIIAREYCKAKKIHFKAKLEDFTE